MLTPAQRQALELAPHTAIIANAGSGKTKVLVEKYLSILLTYPDYHPRDLVAITFTEQAARDLRRKILEEIENRLLLVKDPAIRRRLYEVRTHLSSAQISTIHAFCNQLLRTYPVEANVDASFGILSQPEDRIVLDETIRAAFYRVLEIAYRDEQSQEAQFLPLFRTLGRREINALIHRMIARRAESFDVAKLLDVKTDTELTTHWDAVVQKYLEQNFLKNIPTDWYRRLLETSDSTKKRTTTAQTALSSFLLAKDFRTLVACGIELLDAVHTKDWDRIASGIDDTTKAGEFENNILPLLAGCLQVKKLAQEYANTDSTSGFDAFYASLVRSLVSLYKYVVGEYDTAKLAHGLIDHDDSLIKALALVERPEIAAELAERYKFILVDEYQDTDAIQFHIIERITNKLQAASTLTVVGDPKQSIYSFRNAELSLFYDTIEQIRRSPRQKLVELQENFRILPVPLAFINMLFEHVFNTPVSDESPAYLPLVQGRTAYAEGSVEILLARRQPDSLIDEMPEEAECIARKINDIITAGWQIDDNEHGMRPAQYRDIAILQRTRTNQKAIERALHANGIPFSIYGGTGFYTRQEVIDILAYLQFLLDPTNEISLIGTLRSPFFAFEDADLLSIASRRTDADSTFWNAFCRLALKSDSREHWQRAHRQINENLALVGRISAYQLVTKIFEESRIYGIYNQFADGKQIIANLEKFSAMALANESAAFFGTYDFCERLMVLAERDEQEAQAELRTDENTVCLMTIHGAKGLEFPIVILPQLERDLTKRDARQTEIYLDRSLGAFFALRDLESQHWIYKFAQHKKQGQELDEAKRIFYVATTRARDHLILSATLGEKHPPEHSYLRWIEEALDADLSNTELQLIRAVAKVGVYDADETRHEKEITFSIPVTHHITPKHTDAIGIEQYLPGESETDLSAIPASESQSRYSPTQLLHYVECPTKYYLRYILGLPEDSHVSFEFEPAELGEYVKGTVVGRLVHSLLENVEDLIVNDIIDLGKFDSLLSYNLEQLEIYSNIVFTKYRDLLLSHVQSFVSCDFGKAVLSAKDAHAELSLRAMLNERQMLSGVIDRLYKTETGEWEILDYKTDRTPPSKKKLDRYKFQLRFYAYLVSRFDGSSQESINANLFFTNYGIREQFTFSRADLSTVGAELNATVAHIRRDQKAPSLSGIERNYEHCPDCPYFDELESRCIADPKLKRNQPIRLQDSLFQIEK